MEKGDFRSAGIQPAFLNFWRARDNGAQARVPVPL